MRGPLKFIHGAGTRVAVGATSKKNVRMSSTKISGCSNAAKCPGCNTLQSVAHERSAPLSHVVCDEFMSDSRGMPLCLSPPFSFSDQ